MVMRTPAKVSYSLGAPSLSKSKITAVPIHIAAHSAAKLTTAVIPAKTAPVNRWAERRATITENRFAIKKASRNVN